MCSIMGYCDVCAAFSDFQKGFLKTVSRGPDDSRIVDTGKGLLGFHRLSIMGLTPSGMQPFERDGSYVVCNGEITASRSSRRSWKRSMNLSAARTARFCCRCTLSTAWICSKCSTRNLR